MIFVYYLKITEFLDNIDEIALLQKLSIKEQELILPIKNSMQKHIRLYSHLLKRIVLTEYLDIDNKLLEFGESIYGKPYLVNFPNIYFNISQSEGITALVISDLPVGIDCEKIILKNNLTLTHFLTADELEYCSSPSKFYEIWTKKEAYSKLKGDGLNMPFSSFSVISNLIDGYSESYNIGDCIISVASPSLLPAISPISVSETELLSKAFKLQNTTFFKV